MKKTLFILAASLFMLLPSYSQSKKTDLSITAEDIYILPGDENGLTKDGSGYHLFIRKKAGIESVLLIESNKDPEGKQTNYAYRATSYNKINGDEIRYLDGKVLSSESSKYSLIDSTAEANEKFGQAFHIYIPETVVYGYPWTRNGTISLTEGLFINIRSFSKKYADYTGPFMDNSFNVSKKVSKTVKKEPSVLTKETSKNESKIVSEKATAPVKNEKIEKKSTLTSEEKKAVFIKNELAANDKSAGNFAEKLEAYNSSYVTVDEVDLETISSIPFEEEDLPDYYFNEFEDDEEDYDYYYNEDYDNDENELENESGDNGSSVEDVEENPETVVEQTVEKAEKDIPVLTPFEEEELPVEEEPEPEPEPVEEIPEDERDPISETPYDEDTSAYDPEKFEKSKRVFDGWVEKTEENAGTDSVKPFAESMEGVDPNFVAKLEQAEAARLAKEAKNAEQKEEKKPVKPELGTRFITHGIEMLKVEGSKKIADLYISRTEVTQIAYAAVTGSNPSSFIADFNPVETVSWYDVIVFCNLLSIQDGLVPCYSIKGARNPGAWGPVPKDIDKFWNAVECDFEANGYRMLTVEEWEYAANGGVNKQSGKFAGSNYIDEVAWYKDNSEEITHMVATKNQNACGLYDMCGNVSEWCMGSTGSSERTAAVRGGNYSYDKKYCRTDFKDSCQAWFAHYENGIRICRNVE